MLHYVVKIAFLVFDCFIFIFFHEKIERGGGLVADLFHEYVMVGFQNVTRCYKIRWVVKNCPKRITSFMDSPYTFL